MNIGKRIAELRTENGMSQQKLADLLFVSRDLVSKWECNSRTPDYPTVERMAELFGVDSDLIINKKDLVFEELSECVIEISQIPLEILSGFLNDFVRNLNEMSAGIFLERYYYLKTPAEISGKYRISENYVRSILSKTRKKLNKYIKERLS
ncbi:MAG: helix-turn-helix transcriptional regulator [Clostridia bacterium]|nr:helix-turn-helix transcriptional regulator [Clostridia bacterium]